MLRYLDEAADPAVAHPRCADPLLTFVVQVNAPEFQEWRNGIRKQLAGLEEIMRASREVATTDNDD